jgi:hypothetical protein
MDQAYWLKKMGDFSQALDVTEDEVLPLSPLLLLPNPNPLPRAME